MCILSQMGPNYAQIQVQVGPLKYFSLSVSTLTIVCFNNISCLRIGDRALKRLCSYYSMYGHVAKLAEEIKKGAATVEGVEAKLWQV